MYAGHFAIAMAMKARKPELPALPLFIGVGFLDILNGLFIVAGWDRVTANLAAGPYLFFDLTFVDWDHSLLAALIWSVLWGAIFWRDRLVALAASFAAFSHFIADWPVHNGDLALYPYACATSGWACGRASVRPLGCSRGSSFWGCAATPSWRTRSAE